VGRQSINERTVKLSLAHCRALLCSIAALVVGVAALAAEPAEYEVKAAFLLNFTKFVEWSDSDRTGPISICIVGDNPFGRTLEQIVEGESVDDRKIAIQRVRAMTDVHCHVAFFSKSFKEPAKALANMPEGVLTVGESDTFLRDGGMIAFVVENRRVRFDINTTATSTAGLRVSSRLLTVARSVEK
jgi:hypothetical protein